MLEWLTVTLVLTVASITAMAVIGHRVMESPKLANIVIFTVLYANFNVLSLLKSQTVISQQPFTCNAFHHHGEGDLGHQGSCVSDPDYDGVE